MESRTTVEVSDSAGVSIIFTRIAEDAQTCEVTGETLRIGAVDESRGTTLFSVNGAAFLGDGRIAVLNRGTSQVKVFSPTGDLVSEFGRQGQGPEEFKSLWSIHVRGADTLVVGDYRPWRFSFFTPEGELLRRVELKPAMISRPDFAFPLRGGAGFIMEEPSFQAQDEMVDRVVPLRVYGEDGENTGTVGDFWLDRYGYLSREIGYVGNPVFGAKASFSHLRDDLILYGTGRYEQLEVWNIAGELQGIVRWESRGREVAPTDADVWRRQTIEDIESRSEITPEMEPVIAAIHGYCFGVGFELALACDFRIVADDAALALPEMRIGMIPGSGGSARLVRMVGIGRAKQIAMLSRRIPGLQAAEWGIALKAVPRADLDAAVAELVVELRGFSPLAQRTLKGVLNGALDAPLHAAIESEGQAYGRLRSSEDFAEGVESFKAKRKPTFKGR